MNDNERAILLYLAVIGTAALLAVGIVAAAVALLV